MTLNEASIEWALAHLSLLGDSDLFPKPAELEPLINQKEELKTLLTSRDISQFKPCPARRFMVPKDELSFRRATQLSLFDTIILTAIIYQYGEGIENRRPPKEEKKVFSYRYKPGADYWLYDRDYDWTPFWNQCFEKSNSHSHALVLDISDFYNQISHHTIEQQLAESNFPNSAIQWILNLLRSLTAKVSRGIPVGPYSAHLLAEASLIPLDNSLKSHGIEFIRFVDDVIIFTDSEIDSRHQLYLVADILDKQQRLILNKAKTKILTRDQIQKHSKEMVEDRPINDLEKHILSIIRKYSEGNPYQVVLLSEISQEDLAELRQETLEIIIKDYLGSKPTDFIRLRWFLRRLTQIGHPGAVKFCLQHLDMLTPALSDVCHYFLAASQNLSFDIPSLGKDLIIALDNELIKANEYFQICILSLFGRNPSFNHFPSLVKRFESGSSFVKREVILASGCSGNSDWLRELKEQYTGFDNWLQTAFLTAARVLPFEERHFFVNSLPSGNEFVELLKKWTKTKVNTEHCT